MSWEDEARYFADKLRRAPPPRWGPFRPFEVTAQLRTPISVTAGWIALDGLLLHLRLLDVLGRDYYLLPAKLNLQGLLPEEQWAVPLARTGPVWHGSVSVFEPASQTFATKTYKRFETRWTGELREKRVESGRGRFRAYALTQPYIPAARVRFWGCGDVAEVRRLLTTYVQALGNDHRIGWGAVNSIEVTECSEDLSLVCGGRAARALPVDMCEDYGDAAYLAYRPPYWHPANVTLCVPPGARCTLRREGVLA